MHLYSNNISTIATISSFIRSELFPTRSSCSNNFNQSQSALGFCEKNVEIPEPKMAR